MISFSCVSLSQIIPFETLLLQLLKKTNHLWFSHFTHSAFCFCILFGTFVPPPLQEIKKPCSVWAPTSTTHQLINHHLRPARGQVAIVLEILRLSRGHPSQRRRGGLGEDPIQDGCFDWANGENLKVLGGCFFFWGGVGVVISRKHFFLMLNVNGLHFRV